MPDVVVVGAGPAGSSAALALARAGIDVAIVERARFPRRKVCGEYLNAGAVAALDDLGLDAAVRAHASALRGVRLIAPSGASVQLPFARPALACAREQFDDLLLRAAVAAGAMLVHGRVEALVHDGARVTGVRVQGDAQATTLHARCIVGADGCGSIVARGAGLLRPSRGRRRFAVGGHYRGFGALDGHVEMYVGSGAYFALNPLAPERTNVMVVVPQEALERWSRDVDEGIAGEADRLGHGYRSFAAAERLGPRVAVGPLAHDVRRAAAPGVLLAGDAAGFLNPFTGQGVALALASGVAAARTIVAALADRSAEDRSVAAYARERGRDLAARRRMSAAVALLVDVAPLARRAVARLQRSPALAHALIDALSGAGTAPRGLHPALLTRLVL